VQCLRKDYKRIEKENLLFLRIYMRKILSLNFSVENDPMKGVESFTVLFLRKIK